MRSVANQRRNHGFRKTAIPMTRIHGTEFGTEREALNREHWTMCQNLKVALWPHIGAVVVKLVKLPGEVWYGNCIGCCYWKCCVFPITESDVQYLPSLPMELPEWKWWDSFMYIVPIKWSCCMWSVMQYGPGPCWPQPFVDGSDVCHGLGKVDLNYST